MPIIVTIGRQWHHVGAPAPSRHHCHPIIQEWWRTDAPELSQISERVAQIDTSQIHTPDQYHHIHHQIKQRIPHISTNTHKHHESNLAIPFRAFIHHTHKLRQLHQPTRQSILHAWFHTIRRHKARLDMRQQTKMNKKQQIAKAVAVATEAAHSHNHLMLYKAIRKLSPKQPFRSINLRSEQGNLLDPQEAADDISRWLTQLYQHPDPPECPEPFVWPFNAEELTAGLEALPATKSLAPAFASAPIWKLTAHQVATHCQPLIERWSPSHPPLLPQEWSTGHLALLIKPGKQGRRPQELRPIALLEPVSKTTMGLLAAALKAQVGDYLQSQPQYAYLQWRGRGDSIQKISAHCRLIRTMRNNDQYKFHHLHTGTRPKLAGGVLISLDLSKAFDTVDRRRLFAQMHHLHIDSSLISLVQAIYSQSRFSFEYKGCFRQALTQRGIQQGCKAAPLLWAIFTSGIIDKLSSLFGSTWIHTALAIFADDWVIFEQITDHESLQQVLQGFGQVLEILSDFGLSINWEKTAAMLSLFGSQVAQANKRIIRRTQHGTFLKIQVGTQTQHIRLVSHIQYLGVTLGYHHFESQTLQTRLKSGKKAAALLHYWLCGRHNLPRKHRILIWRQCVFTCCAYGLLDVGLTKNTLIRFDQLCILHLRRMFRSPVHITLQNHSQFLEHNNLPDPLHLLRTACVNLRLRDALRRTYLTENDILHSHEPLDYDQQLAVLDEVIALRRDRASSPQTMDTGLICWDCNQYFSTVAQLKRHRRAIHDDIQGQLRCFNRADASDGVPTCNRCGMMFTRWPALKYHIEFVCIADLQDSHQHALQELQQKMIRHQVTGLVDLHQDQDLLTLLTQKCGLCLHTATPKGLLRHWAIEHAKAWSLHGHYSHSMTDADGHCLYCGAQGAEQHTCHTMRQFAMFTAQNCGTPPREALLDQLYHCEICSQTYITKHGLDGHMAKYHPKDHTPAFTDDQRSIMTCAALQDDCQLILANPALLSRLETTCSLCEITCANRAMLKRHLKQQHTSLWPQAADLELQVAQQLGADTQCYCDPPVNKSTSALSSLSLLSCAYIAFEHLMNPRTL